MTSGGLASQAGSGEGSDWAVTLPDWAVGVAEKRAALLELPQDGAREVEFREAFTKLDQALAGIGDDAYGGLAAGKDARYLRAALKFYVGFGHLNVEPDQTVTLDGPDQTVTLDGEEVPLPLGEWLLQLRREPDGLDAHQVWVKPVLAAWGVDWGAARTSAGGGAVGGEGGSTEGLAERLGTWAEAVAGAYGGERWSGEARGAFERLERGLGGVLAGLSDTVPRYLRAALKFYLENGHVNAPRDKPVVLADGPVHLGDWLYNLRRGRGAGRGLVEPFLTALGWGDEGAVRAARERLAKWWGSLAKAVADAYGPNPNSDETHRAVEAFAGDLGIGWDGPSGQVAGHLRAALAHYLENDGDVNAPVRTKLGQWQADLRSRPGPHRDLAWRSMTALGMRWEKFRDLGMGMPWPDARVLPGEGAGPAASVEQPAMSGGEGGDADLGYDLLGWLSGPGGAQASEPGLAPDAGPPIVGQDVQSDLASRPHSVEQDVIQPGPMNQTGPESFDDTTVHEFMEVDSPGGNGLDGLDGMYGLDGMGVPGDDFPGGVLSLDGGVFGAGVNPAVTFDPFSQDEDLLGWLSGPGGAQAPEPGLAPDAGPPIVGQDVQPDLPSRPHFVQEDVMQPGPMNQTGPESFDGTLPHELMEVDQPGENGGESFIERVESPGPDTGNPRSYLDILDDLVDLVDLDDQEGQDFLFGTTVHQFMEWDPSHQNQQGHFAEPAAPLILETGNPGFGVQGPPVDAVHGNRVVWRGVQQDLLPGSDRAPHDLTPGPQNDSTGIDAVGGEGGATEELAERLKTWAEAVAGAYGGERWSGEARGAFERLEGELGGVLAGLSGNVLRYLRAALKFYLDNGHVNAAAGRPVVLADGPVNLGDWLRGLRRDEGAGRGLVEPFLTALGWGDEGAVRAARELLAKWWGSLAKAVADAYVRDPDSDERHHAVAKFEAELGVDRDRRYNQVAGHLRAALAHYLENNGDVNAPKPTTLGVWQADLRSNPSPRRDLAGPSMTALGMRWERIRGVGMGMPWPDEGGDADLRSVREARLVRDPGAPEGDLTHPEWDLTQPEWDLIKDPLEEAVPKVAPRDVRRYFDAVMYRGRNGLAMKAEVPRDPDRYHAKEAGTKQFYTWARAGALRKVWIIVSDNPEVHHVVQDAVKAVFGVAEDYLDRERLKSIPSVTRGAAQPSAQGNSDGDEAR
ncbi:hypothetical protein [Streptomyces sp. NPDC052036]|uniref:hypothetical protein n=1 Tax=Streptomyces sp. NPDC052036 TaxID=3155171 RepID=UPI00343FB479